MKRSREEEDSALEEFCQSWPLVPDLKYRTAIPRNWLRAHQNYKPQREAAEHEILLHWFLLREVVSARELPLDIFYGVMAPLALACLTVPSEEGIRVRLYEPLVSFMLRALVAGHSHIAFFFSQQRFILSQCIRRAAKHIPGIRLVVCCHPESNGGYEYIYDDLDGEFSKPTPLSALLDKALLDTKIDMAS